MALYGASIAVVLPDHRRHQIETWDDADIPADFRLGVVNEDLIIPAKRQLPDVEIEMVPSIRSFFTDDDSNFDGLIMAAEEGAAWNVLYPEHTVVVPQPIVQRPVGMAVRSGDLEWIRFLDGWLEFERLDGSLERLRKFWIEGGGTQKVNRRWSVIRDVLHWLP